MNVTSFDATHAVRFNLPRGSVHTRGDDERVVLVPAAALSALVASAASTAPAFTEAVDALGRALGSAIGRRAATRTGHVEGASIEAFVTQLAGEAAIAGIGALSVERWGRAMVVVIEDSPIASALLAPIVASSLEAAFGRRAWGALLSRDDRIARVFVGSEGAVGRARDWIASGMAWGEAVVKLHGAGA
jgi:hypothetical protein